jgi:hypothetical protein
MAARAAAILAGCGWGRAAAMNASSVAAESACGCSPMVRKRGAGREKMRRKAGCVDTMKANRIE